MSRKTEQRQSGGENHCRPAGLQGLPWGVQSVPVTALKAPTRRTRTHSKAQIRAISNSMLRFGVMNPVIADDHLRVVAGSARLEAARQLGLQRIPVIRVSHLSETELRAYALADNKLVEKGGWDREALAIELEELQVALPKIGLDLDITGFDPGEVDAIMTDFAESADPADEVPDANIGPSIAKPGDLFILNGHRILGGDARDPAAYKRLMKGDLANMAFLDPPYNVKVLGHMGGRGRVKHREFTCASGEMTSTQFTKFLEQSLGLCAANTSAGSIHFVCMDWRHASELLQAGAATYDTLLNLCVWVKTNAGQGSFYRSQHELVFVFKHGGAPHINTFGLGQNGRSRSNVWRYAGVNTFRAGRMDELKMHPTVKPVALVVDAMRDCSRRGSVILDAFAGSGTSIMAAEQIGRRAFCMELDPAYVDVAIRRWQRFTGCDAVLEDGGATFDDLAAVRATDPDQNVRAASVALRKRTELHSQEKQRHRE
jgi:DNA modification methylase